MKPAYQGSLDGLCGMYAIANALVGACGVEEDARDLMLSATRGLAASRWPDVLFNGTTFADMQRMIRRVLDEHDLPGVRVNYPFQRNTPASNEEYWERFEELFADDEVRCAILGVNQPFAHWIVAGDNGGRIQFMDSTSGNEFLEKNKASLFAGERRPKPTSWLLDRKEVILFSVVRS